jgi:5-carboxymethyl-2-hydroxymuconate isomerase
VPHVVVLYTANLEMEAGVRGFCRAAADALLGVRDENGKAVFPTGGIRVFAYPATHYAVADGSADYGFIYVQLRMGRGRSALVHQAAGTALGGAARAYFAPLMATRPLGLTVQVDEGAEVFDAKIGNLHEIFNKKVS